MIATRLLKISALYLFLGAGLGLFMGISKDFTLASVHTHVTLLGWVALAFAGVIYILLPACATNRLAKAHFWGHNIALPVMMSGLALYKYGFTGAEPFVALGSTVMLASFLVLVVNLFLNGRLQVSDARAAAIVAGATPSSAMNEAVGLR